MTTGENGMKTYRIIIAGGRAFKDYPLLVRKMGAITKNLDLTDLEIVSGVARGADQAGEQWARKAKIPIKQFHADWKSYNKSAGYVRNNAMAQYATHLVAFWDGESPGTRHMIQTARQAGLKVKVVRY